MNIKSVRSLYLSKKDVKEAVILLLAERHEFEVGAHLRSNDFDMVLSKDGELIVDMGGVFSDREA